MTLHVDIDPHGRLVPQSDEARRALADRAGRFALLPSAPDLLIFARTPAAGGVAPRPRCAFVGDLSAFPIGDLVTFLNQSKLTGVLTVVSGGTERSLAFKDGEIRSVRSSAPGERLGDVTVRLGYATEAQVAQAAGHSKPIGKALVELKLISANELWKCLHEQVATVFQAMLLSRTGTYHLIDEDVPDHGTPLSVNTQSLLMDGIRRIDEMSLFRARIPGPDVQLRRKEPRIPISLKRSEQQLLSVCDGRTVAEAARAAHMNEFETTKLLFHLAEAGYVESHSSSADPAERLRLVTVHLCDGLRRVAAALPEKARPNHLALVRSFLGDSTSPFASVFEPLALAADGGLDTERVVAHAGALDEQTVTALESSGDRTALLYRALREMLFFSLFVAGEWLTPEKDQALSDHLKDRLARAEALL